jgi:hypothetical protein
MMFMSLDLDGQGGNRVEQDTSPLEHEKEHKELEQGWPCRHTMHGAALLLPEHEKDVDLVVGCSCCAHVDMRSPPPQPIQDASSPPPPK